ncbi:flagellar basal-body MS-ring/collar protein FliF [Phyllobacterium sp. OV277]|uniref:flagellar basal-body MS-ring/collar protein FliF n=1 Tax=Phyllobacterium sp. OV277 TaxID=1882772 RepID=UPI00088DE51D|nr:flagellar basal-body MS-ring/collar protein FliF [Phyllobacterium sp. OV277]SDP79563.1 flagellar M-ring protein FliF [Phyllobacterium sp. OV277]
MEKNIRQSFGQFLDAMKKLGARRLIGLAVIGITLFSAILISSVYLNRPQYETLYVGLSRDDVNRMGMALGEAGIPFDVKSDGTSVLVPFGKADQARMYLAEKGLPTSNNAGYELFDNMGSLGLTSFMQEITRVRALEGEISRTIQAIRGIKAARVHIVLPEKGSFRRGDQAPSASVVIRTEGGFSMESAQSIRQLVAAAVPQLTPSEVTVLDTNGRLLASKDDGSNAGAVMSATLEQNVSSSVDDNIRKALAPYLGIGHFQTSVQVALDTDKRQTNETVFDPESRVERSVRVVRESGDSKNSKSDNATGVEQNIPQEEIQSKNGDNSTEKTDKREELTNYEVNSKTISTVSDSYQIKRLSIAVVIDQARLLATAGVTPVPDKFVEQQIAKITELVATAAGLDQKRGDVITVTALNFMEATDEQLQPTATPLSETIFRQAGSFVNAAALIVAVGLILWFGVRPLMREMAKPQDALQLVAGTDVAVPDFTATSRPQPTLATNSDQSLPYDDLSELRRRMRVPAQNRLEQMIEMDEERVAAILKQWVHEAA